MTMFPNQKSNSQIVELIQKYSKMTSEAIKVNPNLNGLKLSRARFLRLIAFHQNFFQQMLPDESGMISILNILFIDLELLISTFEVSYTSFMPTPINYRFLRG